MFEPTEIMGACVHEKAPTTSRDLDPRRHDSLSSEPPTSPTQEDLSMEQTSETSWSEAAEPEKLGSSQPHPTLASRLHELFEENITAKICRTATKSLEDKLIYNSNEVRKTPIAFPEIVPQEGPHAGQYEFRDPDFWTCGFFPGTLYALLERTIKYPQTMHLQDTGSQLDVASLRAHLQNLCNIWADPLHGMASRTDTHDIGFIIMPALQRDWELTGNQRSLDSIVRAAHSLVTRYIPSAGAIRSWDCLLKKDIMVTDMNTNLLAIIDSLCNLDLLYYASAHTGDTSLADMATTHARTLLRTHFRPESARTLAKDGYKGQLYSTCHVANIDPATGDLKWRWTAQGYSNDSTWSRGQAWAILGLDTAPACVDIPVFSHDGIITDGTERRTKGRRVPLWDFDAPIQNLSDPLRDSSAGVIAANGMLLLSQALRSVQQHPLSHRFFNAAIEIVTDTIDHSLSTEKAQFTRDDIHRGITIEDSAAGKYFDGILKHGTANNNENARRRYANHGLVYGDYYLVEFGNRLLNMSMV
ncbi:Unsaturated chondroitin disaccharide hydrolase [Colletotrichum sp. SAR 10_77]|nr:Unsaturated chondroitin disaccharide hydrolase [Colletotrichum sp. SAR 10_77]